MSNKTNLIIAGLAVAGVVAYLATGDLIIGGTGEHTAVPTPAENAAQQAEVLFSVRVEKMTAQPRAEQLIIRGRTEADNIVDLSAQTSGLVEEIAVERGQKVKEGDLICRLEIGSRTARISQAEAQLAQAEADFEANTKLNKSGYVADSRIRLLKAQKDAAEAALKEAKLDLERTEIRAPFAGTIENLPAKQGRLLNVGNTCATLVSVDPLLFIGQVSERSVAKAQEGAEAILTLVTGESRSATVTFVSESADEATRTFRVEATVRNGDNALRAGVTAALTVPLEPVLAHFVSGSVLTLNDEGVIGVRGVDENDTVVFYPVSIIGEEPNGVWLSGLPQSFSLITVGQDFVLDGQKVSPTFVTAETEGAK